LERFPHRCPAHCGAPATFVCCCPGYRQVLEHAGPLALVAHLPAAGEIPPCSIAETRTADGLVVHIVLCSELYDRPGLPYADASGVEFADNDIRFARLALAAAELAMRGVDDWRPSVLHLNDWPAALAAAYLAWQGAETPSLLTIHNLAHQGNFEASRRHALAIPEHAFTMRGIEFYGKISFLKAGMIHAAHVTTVSATYAEEITRSEFGFGLDGVLAQLASQGRLSGILNGIDETWDPERDRLRAELSCPHRWKCRYADYLRGAYGLELSGAPLFSMVSRLAPQKGVNLVIDVARTLVELGGQLVVMGRGSPEFAAQLQRLAANEPQAIVARISYEDREARALFAASDFLLMPSHFEPCGLSQMYAQRFGALPIARRTGGLAETIEDERTGFLFDQAETGSLLGAVRRALGVFASPKRFFNMREAAMAKRFDWNASAEAYLGLYRVIESGQCL
jgi:starch synthase